jgi:hypothetical protein
MNGKRSSIRKKMPKVRKNVVILGAITGGLVVAAGAGVGAYVYYKKKKTTDLCDPLPFLPSLTGMKVNDSFNLTENAMIDAKTRTATVTIIPFSTIFMSGGGYIRTTPVPDCIMPKANISLGLGPDVLDQAQITKGQGSATVRFYPEAGDKSCIKITYSPNNADGTPNTSHFWPFEEGKFELLAPLVLKWSF